MYCTSQMLMKYPQGYIYLKKIMILKGYKEKFVIIYSSFSNQFLCSDLHKRRYLEQCLKLFWVNYSFKFIKNNYISFLDFKIVILHLNNISEYYIYNIQKYC